MNENAITKAIIPAAGLGTRMRPLSELVPKELFPVGTRPAIRYAIDECADAGCTDVAVVLSPDKVLVGRYLESIADDVGLRFHVVEQDEPLGLGDAMTRCRELLDGDPFLMTLPDNVFLSPRHSLRRMVEVFARHGDDVLGVIDVSHAESGTYGNCGRIEYRESASEPGVLRIDRLHDKQPGRLEVAPGETVRRSCGRMVFRSAILDLLEDLRPETAGELDEVPAVQRIVAERGVRGVVLEPPLFDVGNPAGYVAAAAELHRRGAFDG